MNEPLIPATPATSEIEAIRTVLRGLLFAVGAPPEGSDTNSLLDATEMLAGILAQRTPTSGSLPASASAVLDQLHGTLTVLTDAIAGQVTLLRTAVANILSVLGKPPASDEPEAIAAASLALALTRAPVTSRPPESGDAMKPSDRRVCAHHHPPAGSDS